MGERLRGGEKREGGKAVEGGGGGEGGRGREGWKGAKGVEGHECRREKRERGWSGRAREIPGEGRRRVSRRR